MADPAHEMAVRPDSFLIHWRDMRDARDEAGTAQSDVARAKKAAKRDGVDLDVVKLVEKLSTMETDERDSFLAKVETYCKWLELPLGAFSAGLQPPEPKASSRESFARWQAGQDGYKAGLDGAPKEANPNRAGSADHVEWAKKWKTGFDANQRKIAASMAKKARASAKDSGASGKMAAAGEGLPSQLN